MSRFDRYFIVFVALVVVGLAAPLVRSGEAIAQRLRERRWERAVRRTRDRG